MALFQAITRRARRLRKNQASWKRCPACGREVRQNSTLCPHCDYRLS